jgi:hypothetical protein
VSPSRRCASTAYSPGRPTGHGGACQVLACSSKVPEVNRASRYAPTSFLCVVFSVQRLAASYLLGPYAGGARSTTEPGAVENSRTTSRDKHVQINRGKVQLRTSRFKPWAWPGPIISVGRTWAAEYGTQEEKNLLDRRWMGFTPRARLGVPIYLSGSSIAHCINSTDQMECLGRWAEEGRSAICTTVHASQYLGGGLYSCTICTFASQISNLIFSLMMHPNSIPFELQCSLGFS